MSKVRWYRLDRKKPKDRSRILVWNNGAPYETTYYREQTSVRYETQENGREARKEEILKDVIVWEGYLRSFTYWATEINAPKGVKKPVRSY